MYFPHMLGVARGISRVLQVTDFQVIQSKEEDTRPALLQISLTTVVLFKHKFGCTRNSLMHGNINMRVGAGQH